MGELRQPRQRKINSGRHDLSGVRCRDSQLQPICVDVHSSSSHCTFQLCSVLCPSVSYCSELFFVTSRKKHEGYFGSLANF